MGYCLFADNKGTSVKVLTTASWCKVYIFNVRYVRACGLDFLLYILILVGIFSVKTVFFTMICIVKITIYSEYCSTPFSPHLLMIKFCNLEWYFYSFYHGSDVLIFSEDEMSIKAIDITLAFSVAYVKIVMESFEICFSLLRNYLENIIKVKKTFRQRKQNIKVLALVTVPI